MPKTAMEAAMTSSASAPTTVAKKKGPSQTAFDQVSQLALNRGKKLKELAEHGKEAGLAGLHSVETLGTTFLASMAKGAWGKDKFRPGKVPVLSVTGGALVLWGLYDELNGESGGHQMAFGTGLIASDLADFGSECGVRLADSWKKDKQTPASAAIPAEQLRPATPPGGGSVKVSGPERELSMGLDDDFGRERGGSKRESHTIVPAKILTMSRTRSGRGTNFADE